MELLLFLGGGFLLYKYFQSREAPESFFPSTPAASVGPTVEEGENLIIGEEQIPEIVVPADTGAAVPVAVQLNQPETAGDVAITEVVTSHPQDVVVTDPGGPNQGWVYFKTPEAFNDALMTAGFSMPQIVDQHNALIDEFNRLNAAYAQKYGWKAPNILPTIVQTSLADTWHLAELGTWNIVYSDGSKTTRMGAEVLNDLIPRWAGEIENLRVLMNMG
jgi:hypothetical protein